MSENSDDGGGSQISALDDLVAGGVAGSASVIVGRKLDLSYFLCLHWCQEKLHHSNNLDSFILCLLSIQIHLTPSKFAFKLRLRIVVAEKLHLLLLLQANSSNLYIKECHRHWQLPQYATPSFLHPTVILLGCGKKW